MSLKIYTIINTFVFLVILLFFAIISSIFISFTQFDFSNLVLYIFRNITHLFEIYNIVVLSLFFIAFILITYYVEKMRNLFFVIFFYLILILTLNSHDLKSFFIYENQSINQYFYAYSMGYVVSFILWYILIRKNWKHER